MQEPVFEVASTLDVTSVGAAEERGACRWVRTNYSALGETGCEYEPGMGGPGERMEDDPDDEPEGEGD